MRVRWARPALAHLQEIADFIARDNPVAADALLAEILDIVERLRRFPLMGRPGPAPDTREVLVRRNYLITYRVWRDEIEVLAIWHGAQSRLAPSANRHATLRSSQRRKDPP